jgi:hypothetical protein
MTIKLASLKGLEEPLIIRVRRGFHRVGLGLIALVVLVDILLIFSITYEGEFWQHIETILLLSLSACMFLYAFSLLIFWVVSGFLPNE